MNQSARTQKSQSSIPDLRVYLEDGKVMGFVQKEGAKHIVECARRAGFRVTEYFDLVFGRPAFNVRRNTP